jgi:hypothetical protein
LLKVGISSFRMARSALVWKEVGMPWMATLNHGWIGRASLNVARCFQMLMCSRRYSALKEGVVVRTMFSRLLALTDATTGFDSPLAAKAALKALLD